MKAYNIITTSETSTLHLVKPLVLFMIRGVTYWYLENGEENTHAS